MSTVLVPGVATLSVTTQPLPSTNAAQASNSVVVTDAASSVYAPVVLTGAESTPWAWAATYAAGPATAVVTPLDVNGATIGTPLSTTFTVVAAIPATFEAPSSIAFVAASTSAAVAAVHAALKK
jgi:hypothetical protein